MKLRTAKKVLCNPLRYTKSQRSQAAKVFRRKQAQRFREQQPPPYISTLEASEDLKYLMAEQSTKPRAILERAKLEAWLDVAERHNAMRKRKLRMAQRTSTLYFEIISRTLYCFINPGWRGVPRGWMLTEAQARSLYWYLRRQPVYKYA